MDPEEVAADEKDRPDNDKLKQAMNRLNASLGPSGLEHDVDDPQGVYQERTPAQQKGASIAVPQFEGGDEEPDDDDDIDRYRKLRVKYNLMMMMMMMSSENSV
nr:hypothetical protein BaRGS_025286 [Batillaria attramentaria]